jgi:hypothetical protein
MQAIYEPSPEVFGLNRLMDMKLCWEAPKERRVITREEIAEKFGVEPEDIIIR